MCLEETENRRTGSVSAEYNKGLLLLKFVTENQRTGELEVYQLKGANLG